MRKLTDVYIKVNKSNHQWLSELFDSSSLELNTYIVFYAEDYRCKYYYDFIPQGKQKVSLSQLKRLINTIPTREEITRLKRQISAYKTNLSLVNERCKELNIKNEMLNVSHFNYERELKEDNEELKRQLKDVNERCKELQSDNESLKHRLIKLRELNDVIYKDVDRLTIENKQLKQRKWYQFW